MTTENAKNFAAGSLCDQGYYFDELEDRINFPDMFPASLLSCALLEMAMNEQHDRRLARSLRSNDVLNVLVDGPEIIERKKGLGKSGVNKLSFNCFGVVQGQQVLYRAEVHMAPLHSILNRGKARASRSRKSASP